MLKIRLARIGRKNDPTFRVVVVDSHSGPKTGKHVEVLGNYNPKQKSLFLNGERIKHWISHGAQVSDTVHNLLIKENIIEGKKINVLPKKSPIKKEAEKIETQADLPANLSADKAGKADEKGKTGKVETPPKDEEASKEEEAKAVGDSSPDASEEASREEETTVAESDSKEAVQAGSLPNDSFQEKQEEK